MKTNISVGKTMLAAMAVTSTLWSGQSAQAALKTWSGATNNLWNVGANWSGTVPATGDSLIFTSVTGLGGTTLSDNLMTPGTYTLGGITFNLGSAAFTINPNTVGTNGFSITAGSSLINNSAASQTINSNIALLGNSDFNAALSTGSFNLGGVISGTGSRVQATGLGIVTLNGSTASTYTGATSASGNGTLVVDLSNIAGNTNLINTGSQLSLGNGNAFANGTIIIKGAASGASSQTFNGLNVGGTSGTILINPSTGSGTNLNLGTTANRTAGSVVTFDISATGATLTGTTLGLTAAAQTVNQGLKGYALVKDSTGIGFGANVGGSLVRYTGASALTAGGLALTTTAANNYSLSAGGATTSLATTQTVNTLNINTAGSAGVLDIGAGVLTVTSSGIITSGNAALTIQGGQLGATNSEIIVHAIGTGGVTISSNISGGTTGAFTKAGSDTLTLSGTNTYSGITSVIGGILKAGSSTAFSANSTYTISNSAGVGLDLNGFDVTVGSLAGPQAQAGATGGGISLGANTLTVGGKNVAIDFSGVISGTGGVTKVGTGIWDVRSANTYTGATTVNGGTFRARNASALGVNSAVTVGASGIVDTFGNNVSIGSLAGSGSVTNNNASTNVVTTGSDNTNTNFSGSLSNGSTPGTMIIALTKTGSGTQTLSGSNTYTGATTVSAGALLISGSLGTTAVTVNSGGSFGAGGTTAAMAGTLTVASGGKLGLADGSGSILTLSTTTAGGLNVSGAVGGANTGGLVFELGAAGASDEFVLSSTGTLNIGSGVLNWDDFNFVAIAGFGAGTYTLFDTNAAIIGTLGSTLTGTISGLSGTLTSNGQDITLTVVPEPSTYALLGTGLFTLWALRRRVRKG